MTSEVGPRDWALDTSARRIVHVWAAVVGIEVGQSLIPNFRIAVGDVLLVVASLLLLAGGRWGHRLRSLPRGPLMAIVALGVAIAVGLVVDRWRYGFIIREAWFNKGVGLLLLGSIVFVVGSTIRSADQAITLIRAYLIGAMTSTMVAFLLWAAYWIGFAPEGLAPFGVRFVGFLLSPNAAAIYFSTGLILSLGATAGASYALGNWKLWAAVSALFLAAILLTLSRSTWFAIFAASLLLAFWRPRLRLLSALAAALLLVLLMPAIQAAVAPTVEQLLGSGTVSFLRKDEGTGGFATTPSPTPAVTTNPTASPSSTAASVPSVVPSASGTRPPTATPPALATALPTSPPEPSHVTPRDQGVGYFQNASDVATDRYGFNDRVFIDVVAFRLWRQDLGTVVTGLGLEGFPLLAIATELGEPVDIHSTYVWLPVEMGLAGVVALGMILYVLGITSRRLWTGVPRELAAPLMGVLALYLAWWIVNEGLYQRSFWLFLTVASICGAVMRRRAS